MTRTGSSSVPKVTGSTFNILLASSASHSPLRFPLITAVIYHSHTGVVISATTPLIRTFHVTLLDLCVFKTYDQRHLVITMH